MVEEVNRTRTIPQEALAVDAVEVLLGALSTAVCPPGSILLKVDCNMLMHILILYFDVENHTVMVDGLPSSASWQDLKVLELYMTSVCRFCCAILNFS
jgi:hypothetical protein